MTMKTAITRQNTLFGVYFYVTAEKAGLTTKAYGVQNGTTSVQAFRKTVEYQCARRAAVNELKQLINA